MSAKHPTSFEITKERHLTPRGDCIIAVSANKCFQDLSEKFKEMLRNDNSILEIKISCQEVEEKIIAHGNSKLILTHSKEMVIRKSNFICERTLAIKADKAAKDLSTALIEKLKNPKATVVIELTIK
ncbi:MAG: DUF371 domain-containing protein [Candidatus Altiarchaeota archaeon]